MGSVIGFGIATLGADGVFWGWEGCLTSICCMGNRTCNCRMFGIIVFTITKYVVIKPKDLLRAGLSIISFYFAMISGILTMVIVWKGGEQ